MQITPKNYVWLPLPNGWPPGNLNEIYLQLFELSCPPPFTLPALYNSICLVSSSTVFNQTATILCYAVAPEPFKSVELDL